MIFKMSTVVELYYIPYKYTTLITTAGYITGKYNCGRDT